LAGKISHNCPAIRKSCAIAREPDCTVVQTPSRGEGTERCAGHGSYNCNQIILTEERTITFDWDSYDVADPGRGVARFLVALQRLAFK